MIHIQIEEAPLLPTGQLAKNESSWVPLEDFNYISDSFSGGYLRLEKGYYVATLQNKDYAFVRGEKKTINLDAVSAGPNYVLTGVRLSHESEKYNDDVNIGNTSPLQLEIHVTPFNYTSGKLTPTEENPSVWITPLTQPNLPSAYAEKRQEIVVGAKTYQSNNAENTPNHKPNQFIKFRQSTIWDDAGQSTIPFMDSRPTAPYNVLALNGLGLIYRGHKDYGGFLAFNTMTIDLSNYIDSSMTDKQRKYYTTGFRKAVSRSPSKRNNKKQKNN